MYATLGDLRDEGVTEAMASDARATELLKEASQAIDRHTGWFFEPRSLTLQLDGRGTPSLEPPVPPIALTRLTVLGRHVSVSPQDVVLIGAPVAWRLDAPRLTRTQGRRFPKGAGTVEVEGIWGYTEVDATTPYGRTPLEIRRACLLMALRWWAPLADDDATARHRWRIIEERTRDQSYRLDRMSAGTLTGDPDIDHILERYRRPMGLGAA